MENNVVVAEVVPYPNHIATWYVAWPNKDINNIDL